MTLDGMSAEARAAIEAALLPPLTPWIPFTPTPKQQAAFLLEGVRELLYGGAAGGAKSWWLLGEALRHVDTPNYSAILFRNTLPDLRQEPNGLIPTLRRFLVDTPAKWAAQTLTWHFPSGATISFGYLQDQEGDRFRRYAGPSWHMIGIDQAEQFRPDHYLFMFSRLRQEIGTPHPLRVRSTANPGGPSHDFLVERFGLLGTYPNPSRCTLCSRKRESRGHGQADDQHPFSNRAFMPSRLEDNPHLDPSYEESLRALGEVEYQRLRYGDFSITTSGALFKTEHFQAAEAPAAGASLVRAWDQAATEKIEGHDPDYTVGVLLARLGEFEWVVDVKRAQLSPEAIDNLRAITAAEDGTHVPIVVEQEGRSAGSREISHIRKQLPHNRIIGKVPKGTKLQRAAQAARWVNTGRVALCGGAWVPGFVSELRSFKGDNRGHDDQVDAFAMAHNWLDENTSRWQPQADQLAAMTPQGITPNR